MGLFPMRKLACFLVLPLILQLAGSCKTTSARSSDVSAVGTRGASTQTPSRNVLETEAEYKGFAQDSGGLVPNGRSVKFLIDLKKTKKIYFINSNYTNCRVAATEGECGKYHYYFALENLKITLDNETFNDQTYFTQDKAYAAGTLSTYEIAGKGIVYAIQLFPQDSAKDDALFTIAQYVRNAFKIPASKLVFLKTGNQQTTSDNIVAKLATLNIDVLTLDTILGATTYLPMHPGSAWGYLRLFPKDMDELKATDIVIFDELPLDLSVVAGTMTKAFQDTNSHINLKSKERNTPNMVLRDASDTNPRIAPWIDKPIHLEVTKQGFKIEATTDEVIQSKLRARLDKPWKPIPWKSTRDILSYDEMCPGAPGKCLQLSAMYGSKAANLGFLKEVFKDRRVSELDPVTKKTVVTTLNYDPVPLGFGIPLQFYADLVALPSNAALKAKIEAFVKLEIGGTLSPAERNAQALEIRNLFLNAEIPGENIKAVLETTKRVASTVKEWKIRSSANAEDIENFDGAGLHDSYSSKLSAADNAAHTCELVISNGDDPGELTKYKVKPKTLSCAIKGVYASMWNKRAIEERSFAHIDHGTIAMALAVVPNYDTESPVIGNSVVVTRVINNSEIMGYSLSIQKDNNTVTNPTPGTWSEIVVAASAGDNEPYSISTLRLAKPTASSEPLKDNVLKEAVTRQMVAVTKKIEEIYCVVNPKYYMPRETTERARKSACKEIAYDPAKEKALDMEMKVLENGQFVIKQVREFSGK